jgi:hypothetical protein
MEVEEEGLLVTAETAATLLGPKPFGLQVLL